jgi:Flp pilus assembly pilin Flp
MERIKRFMARAPRRACDRGASLVEYALLVALISVVCIAAVTQLGGGTSDTTQDAADRIGGSNGCPAGSHRGDVSHPYSTSFEHPSLCFSDAADQGGMHVFTEIYAP